VIELDEKIVAIWYLQITNTQDWMAAIREIEPEEKFELTYRFRYYKDDKAFESKDKKNWYKGTIGGSRAFVIGSLREIAKVLAATSSGGELYELINDKGAEDFLHRLQDMPFAYVRMMSEGAEGEK
jgi:hypothetical protein